MSTLRENEVKSLLDLLSATGSKALNTISNVTPDKVAKSLIGNRNKSILFKSKDTVMHFPVLITESISVDTAMILIKSLEGEYARHLELILNSQSVVNIKNGEELKDFLKKIHTNDFMGGTIGLSDDTIDRLGNDPKAILGIESKSLLQPYTENFNTKPIGSYKSLLEESDANSDTKDNLPDLGTPNIVMRKSDYRKTNNMDPTVVNAQIIYNSGESFSNKVDLLLGVKCVAHPLKSEDIIKLVPESIDKQNILFRFIQWTTGEIRFFKDFMLDIDDAKASSKSRDDRQTRWWYHLKDRANKSKLNGMFGKGKFIPNATMVFNISEMDHIKANAGLDLMNKDSAKTRKLMETYFLLRVIVADDVNEIFYIFDESNLSWHPMTYKDMATKSSRDRNNSIEIKIDN